MYIIKSCFNFLFISEKSEPSIFEEKKNQFYDQILLNNKSLYL